SARRPNRPATMRREQTLESRKRHAWLLLRFSSFEADVQVSNRLALLDPVRDARWNKHEVAWFDLAFDAASNRAAAELARRRTWLRVDERSTGGDDPGSIAHDPHFGDPAVLQRGFGT